jgi:lipopolysaccharide assembly protein A
MLRLIIALPLLLLLVLFALSNVEPVSIGIWPTDFALQVPLSVSILVAAGIAFLLGGLLVWINELGQRRRARRAEENVRVLEEQLEELKARLARPLPPPA